MQTVDQRFTTLAQGSIRPLSYGLTVSFDRSFSDTTDFFTLDDSQLDSLDVLAPDGGNVVQEWDKYRYVSYKTRVMQLEWQREELIPYSVTQAFADITLNNYDGYFTRNNGSPIDQYLLPQRPVRILAGFGNINIPQFVGLTDTAPVVDKTARTARLHCQDFLSYLFDKPLDNAVVLQDVSTDEVLDYLFQLFGLTPSQYVLDVGYNVIPFVYFQKGKKLGEAVKDLMEAELGRLYMDEFGVIRFVNRIRTQTEVVAVFNGSNIIDYNTSTESEIINVVELKANVRTVQPEQTIYTLVDPIELSGGSTSEVFFNFDDPVTSVSAITTYVANTESDGSGSDVTANITVDSQTAFNTAVKVVFANSAGRAYITSLTVTGTPAKVSREVYLRVQDDDSVADFDEQVFSFENEFIQSDDAAQSVALSLLNYYKDYSSVIDMTVKGNFAYQIGDQVKVWVDNINENYVITKISNVLTLDSFVQKITARVYNIPEFFILDSSVLNGEDVLSP